MANEDQVYAFETNFIAALETIISLPATQTRLFGDTETKQTPRIDCGFTYGGADQIDRGLTSEGKQYLRKHNGTITLTVSGTEKDAHLVLVGKVRNFMSWNVPTLINPVLAFYQVQSVFEQSGSNEAGDDEGDFEISTELNFDVVFQIPPVAFTPALIDGYVVAGAGLGDVNGLYLRDGDESGKPRYTLDGGVTGSDSLEYRASDDRWAIYSTAGSPLLKYASLETEVETPDLTAYGALGAAPTPAPTVTQATIDDLP